MTVPRVDRAANVYQGHAICKDCGQEFTWVQLGSGGPRQICDACRRAKRREQERPRRQRREQRRKEENAQFRERLKTIVERVRSRESEEMVEQ